MSENLMSVNDYCESRQVSRTAFYQHKQAGRLTGCFRRKPGGKRQLVIPAAADRALAENVRCNPGGSATRQKHRGGVVDDSADQVNPETEQEITDYLSKTVGELSRLNIAELQRFNELEKLLLARLKRRREDGELIAIAPVQRAAFEAGRQIREQITAIPDRVGSLLAAESGAFECRQILLVEINHVLEGLSKTLAVKGADGPSTEL